MPSSLSATGFPASLCTSYPSRRGGLAGRPIEQTNTYFFWAGRRLIQKELRTGRSGAAGFPTKGAWPTRCLFDYYFPSQVPGSCSSGLQCKVCPPPISTRAERLETKLAFGTSLAAFMKQLAFPFVCISCVRAIIVTRSGSLPIFRAGRRSKQVPRRAARDLLFSAR